MRICAFNKINLVLGIERIKATEETGPGETSDPVEENASEGESLTRKRQLPNDLKDNGPQGYIINVFYFNVCCRYSISSNIILSKISKK